MSPARRSVLLPEEFEQLPFAERQWRRFPWVDRNTGEISITRALAIAGVVIVWHSVEGHHPISGTHLGMYVAALAAAFGKSTFGFFLTRYQMRAAVEQRDETRREERFERIEVDVRMPNNRKDDERGDPQ